ncbi:MAG: MBL fold metallo-hydrolase [Clostridiales bacterium]|nr:MBL fold metallo-hydrolase [Clostridiales bacterium]
MMEEIKITPLFSGSGGNCTYIEGGGARILIDAGVSARRIRRALALLGRDFSEIDGVFLTHEHKDHIGGLSVLCKSSGVPIHATAQSLQAMRPAFDVQAHPVQYAVQVKDLLVESFPLSHDSACCVGYTFRAQGDKAGVLTDTGFVTDEAVAAMVGCRSALVESNHDPERLRNGPYPAYLKARIASARGHLSNQACAEFCAFLAGKGTKRFILAHLSKENNTPDAAYRTAEQALIARGYDAAVECAPVAVL